MLTALLLAAAAPGLPLFANPMTEAALEGFEARPGAWAEYAVVPGVGPRLRVRLSVLGPSLSAGVYWLGAATLPARFAQPNQLSPGGRVSLFDRPGSGATRGAT